MRNIKTIGRMGVLFLLISTGVARADEIWIKNGDHISGDIVRLSDGILTFKTAYIGEINLKWEDIVSLKTDSPIWLKLQNDTSISAAGLVPGETRSVRVASAEPEPPLLVKLAQVEALRPGSVPPGVLFSGRANFGASFSSGNTQNQATASEGEILARGQSNRSVLGWLYQREKSDGERTAENQTASLAHNLFFDKNWYGLTNITGIKDEFKDVSLRTDMGIGAGYQVWESKKRNLAFELGASYVNENFYEAQDDRYSAGRWAIKFDHTLNRTGLQLFHGHEGLYAMEESSEIIIRSTTGFRMPIYNKLTSSVQLKWDWENQPGEGREYSDLNYMLTFGYSF